MSQTNPSEKELNTYALNYILTGEQSASWKKAFPKSKCKKEGVYQKASNLHKNVKIQARIKELRKISKTQSEEEFEISSNEIKKKLIDIVESCLKEKFDRQANKIPISPQSAVSALSEINKMDGNHAAVKNEHSGPNNGPIESVNLDPKEYAKVRKNMLKKDDC